MLHIGTLSSGAASAYACKLMIDEVGKNACTLVFTDTEWEDDDNYRFLNEISEYLDVPLVTLTMGKTPLDLAWDERMLPSNRVPFCSRQLKREPLERYIKEVAQPTTIWWGISWDEQHRAKPIAANWNRKFQVKSRFPLIKQLTDRQEIYAWLDSIGIKRPSLYDYGFDHANCGGRCVRGGLGHWYKLYTSMPERYLEVEETEQRWQREHGKANTILKKSGKAITLRELRTIYFEGCTLFGEELDAEIKHDMTTGSCACTSSYAGE